MEGGKCSQASHTPSERNKRAATEAMDEKQARQRLLEGGYFVALGVPPGVEFGIDLKSYEVPGEV